MNEENSIKENKNEYEISRTYKLKKSTMKMLYQIKANEDDFTVKFNDILASACPWQSLPPPHDLNNSRYKFISNCINYFKI